MTSTTSCSPPTGSRARTRARSSTRWTALGPEALAAAGRRRDAIFMQQGITFDAAGPGRDGPVRDRPFPLDLVPRIIPAEEWTTIKRGLAQRIRALNHFVDDVYHAREIIHEGIVPWELVVSRPGVRARRARHPPARRRLLPRLRLRPRARRRRRLEGARGQRPHAVRHLLRAREPQRDDAAAARPVRRTTACGRSTTTRRCCGARCRRSRRPAGRRSRPSSSGRPGPFNSRLLRARVPRAPDGRRARRGGRPRRPRRDLLHAHDQRPAARARDLPPHRRRLHGPARVPAGLGARRPGPDARLPRRHGRDRQRGRHGRRRRQGDLPLRAGDDPLLPRRGADPRERPDLPDGRPRAARVGARAARPSSWSSRPASPAARASSSARAPREEELERQADGDQARARALDRPGARAALDRPDREPGRRARRRATSTCARSRSSARTSASSPAASRASRCARAR